MLKQRLITAILLLLLVLACLLATSPWPMLILLAVMVATAFWEWLRLAAVHNVAAIFLAGLLLLFLLWLSPDFISISNKSATIGNTTIFLSILFWLFIAPVIVKQALLPAFINQYVLSILGLLLLFACWYALAWVYIAYGAICLLTLWALVWCADIAAYFAGKAFGKHKLAPKVSPGKTWQGAFGGVLAAIIWLSISATFITNSFAALVLSKTNWVVLILIGLVLAAWSIIGDLFESILKRKAGLKDSSKLLPGHGGVYDRIDAVLPVAPMAVFLLIF